MYSHPIIYLFGLLLVIYTLTIHSFLSVHRPIQGTILVVEGWLPDEFLKDAAAAFISGGYSQLITVGGPVVETGNHTNNPTHAVQSANHIRQLLSDKKNRVIAVSSPKVTKQRTKAYAISFRDWLKTNRPQTTTIDVFSAGVHARKSHHIFSKVLSPGVDVGIISSKPLLYNQKFWWLSKRGVFLVIKNSIAYVDALLFTDYIE